MDHQPSSTAASDALGSTSTWKSDDLPAEPGAYEDFDYTNPLDYGFFPSTSSASLFANPFSPSSTFYTNVSTPGGQRAFTPPAGMTPGAMVSERITNQPSFTNTYQTSVMAGGKSAGASPSFGNQAGTTANSMASNTPLFDDTETELFTSFLDTIDIDQNFFFNPVLPPGMPSPPRSLDRPPIENEPWKKLNSDGQSVKPLTISGPELASQKGPSTMGVGGRRDIERDQPMSSEDENTPSIRREFTSPSGGKTRGHLLAGKEDSASRSGKKFKVENRVKQDADVNMEEDDYSMGVGSSNAATPTTLHSASKLRQRRDPSRPSLTPNSNSSSASNRPRVSPSLASNGGSAHLDVSSPPPPFPSTLTRPLSRQPQPDSGSGGSYSGDGEDADSLSATNVKGALTDSQKRSNHILSEQKRRNAIRSGFKDLVDLLTAGEAASGIVVAPDVPDDENGVSKGAGNGVNGSSKRKKSKSSGRGRGRKGEVGAGASKSVVLEKATAYIMWLERGNQALEKEVNRVRTSLEGMGVCA